ncbi:hypothetical protein NKI56_33355 [Mesorhizobium sp. M0622]|uniref:hypothetical protein n=1 Tax=Mesorhizobium sp. M0622 TaxID=2956975 RepID=UPI00333C7CFF
MKKIIPKIIPSAYPSLFRSLFGDLSATLWRRILGPLLAAFRAPRFRGRSLPSRRRLPRQWQCA